MPRATPSFSLEIRALTPELWPQLVELFGEKGACSGCWCMYWRIGAAYRKRPGAENKAAFKRVVMDGPPPGLLAFDGEQAVGWCQITPRDDVPWLDRTWRVARVDDAPVWSITCFFIRIGYRRRGVTRALVEAAVDRARQAGAPAVEAYPLDKRVSPSSTSTGFATTFERAGFTEIARHSRERPILRLQIRSLAAAGTQLR